MLAHSLCGMFILKKWRFFIYYYYYYHYYFVIAAVFSEGGLQTQPEHVRASSSSVLATTLEPPSCPPLFSSWIRDPSYTLVF